MDSLILQEFDLEIRDKNGSENVIVNHLLRLELSKDAYELPMNDYFKGEHLLQVKGFTL